jgi:hypothetical protein
LSPHTLGHLSLDFSRLSLDFSRLPLTLGCLLLDEFDPKFMLCRTGTSASSGIQDQIN